MGRGMSARGDQIRAFSAAAGISERAARNHRAKNSPAWSEWLKKQSAPPPPPAPPEKSAALSEYDRAIAARDSAFDLLTRLAASAASAAPAELPPITRALSDARKNWELACRHAESAAVRARRLIPIETVLAVRDEVIPPLADALSTWQNNIAQRLLPQDRPAFFNAARAEREKLNAALSRIPARLAALA